MFQAKLINSVPFYDVVGQFDLQGEADILYNTVLQTGYQEITDISIIYNKYLESWGDQDVLYVYTLADKSSSKRIDWKYVRDYIRDIVDTTGFDNLSDAHKIIAAKCNAGTKAQQEAILAANFTVQERQVISFNYDFNVEKARNVRASEVIAAFWQFTGHLIVPTTPYPVPAYILTSLITINTPAAGEMMGGLLDLFRTKGLQGIQIAGDGILGIYDFILSTAGTRFETTGLDTNVAILGSGTPSGFASWTAFKDYIFDIIHHGNY